MSALEPISFPTDEPKEPTSMASDLYFFQKKAFERAMGYLFTTVSLIGSLVFPTVMQIKQKQLDDTQNHFYVKLAVGFLGCIGLFFWGVYLIVRKNYHDPVAVHAYRVEADKLSFTRVVALHNVENLYHVYSPEELENRILEEYKKFSVLYQELGIDKIKKMKESNLISTAFLYQLLTNEFLNSFSSLLHHFDVKTIKSLIEGNIIEKSFLKELALTELEQHRLSSKQLGHFIQTIEVLEKENLDLEIEEKIHEICRSHFFEIHNMTDLQECFESDKAMLKYLDKEVAKAAVKLYIQAKGSKDPKSVLTDIKKHTSYIKALIDTANLKENIVYTAIINCFYVYLNEDIKAIDLLENIRWLQELTQQRLADIPTWIREKAQKLLDLELQEITPSQRLTYLLKLPLASAEDLFTLYSQETIEILLRYFINSFHSITELATVSSEMLDFIQAKSTFFFSLVSEQFYFEMINGFKEPNTRSEYVFKLYSWLTHKGCQFPFKMIEVLRSRVLRLIVKEKASFCQLKNILEQNFSLFPQGLFSIPRGDEETITSLFTTENAEKDFNKVFKIFKENEWLQIIDRFPGIQKILESRLYHTLESSPHFYRVFKSYWPLFRKKFISENSRALFAKLLKKHVLNSPKLVDRMKELLQDLDVLTELKLIKESHKKQLLEFKSKHDSYQTFIKNRHQILEENYRNKTQQAHRIISVDQRRQMLYNLKKSYDSAIAIINQKKQELEQKLSDLTTKQASYEFNFSLFLIRAISLLNEKEIEEALKSNPLCQNR